MLRSGRLVILLCSSMNNISLASLPRQIVWIVFYNKWYLFMHFIICDKWWIKCSSFSLTGTWHNYIEPIYINFLLTYWMIISHVFFVWLWWRSNKMKPALNHIFKSELKNLKCHVRKWTCLRLKISNIFGATALSEKRIHRQRRNELNNWEL